MFKGLGDLASIMKQAQQMPERIAAVKEKVGDIRVEGVAGGEMVRVEATGGMKITSVKIEPNLVESGDVEMIEELVAAAVNQALKKAKDEAAAAMAEVTSGMDIPGLGDAMSKLGLSS